MGSRELAIVVSGRSWREISPWKIGESRKERKKHLRDPALRFALSAPPSAPQGFASGKVNAQTKDQKKSKKGTS